jgi:hypothetical protein
MVTPDVQDLRRSFAAWLRKVLLPSRLPGVRLDQVQDLQEVESMLAERVMEWTEQWKREGWREGLDEGRKKGLDEGQAGEAKALLLRLLQRKFGEVPGWVGRRAEGASLEELEGWVERLLSAATVEEVFGQ